MQLEGTAPAGLRDEADEFFFVLLVPLMPDLSPKQLRSERVLEQTLQLISELLNRLQNFESFRDPSTSFIRLLVQVVHVYTIPCRRGFEF